MNKPTITEALQARIPLPWKQSTCDGPPQWKVERQRPEDFTAEIYAELKKYGMLEDDIRNLFYINNADYATLKRKLGAVPPVDDEQEDKPKKQYKNCFPNAKKPNTEPAPALIAPKDRKKVELEPLPSDDGIHAPTSAKLEDVFRPDDEKPVPFVPAPRPLQARIEIICNGATVYDLEQLHSTLMDLGVRKRAVVNGTLRIVIQEGK